MKTAPSEDDVERCLSEISKSVSILPRFLLHRGTADNMQPLTGDGAGRIHMDDR